MSKDVRRGWLHGLRWDLCSCPGSLLTRAPPTRGPRFGAVTCLSSCTTPCGVCSQFHPGTQMPLSLRRPGHLSFFPMHLASCLTARFPPQSAPSASIPAPLSVPRCLQHPHQRKHQAPLRPISTVEETGMLLGAGAARRVPGRWVWFPSPPIMGKTTT